MLLVVDVGNTQTHLGAFRGEELVHDWRFATVRESTADELGARLSNLLALRDLGFGDLDASILSSTVPQLRPEWTAMAERYLGHEMPVVGPGVRTGMPIRMDNPREVGADRLVNAVAAYERVGGPCVIVDFGTALTYDCVGEAGEYIGGIIAPGVEISLEALTSRAAAIPKIDLSPPRALIGKSTVEAIRSGVIYGFASQVDGMVGRLREELGDETEAIATGGLASAIVPFCELIDDVDQMLTLTGLKRDSPSLGFGHLNGDCPALDCDACDRCTTPGSWAGSRSRTASCSRRSRASATGSCACRRSATGPGWR
jgi:type III pantothenate kinase